MFLKVLMLEQAHANGIAVFAVDKELVNQLAFDHKTEFAVDMDRFFVFFINNQIQLIQIENGKAVVHCQLSGARRQPFALIFRGDDNLELGATVNVVYLHQFNQPGFFAIAFDDETAFTLIVNVFVVKVREFDEGLVRLFKPVTHYAGVIIKLVDEAQVFALKRAEFDVRGVRHGKSCVH